MKKHIATTSFGALVFVVSTGLASAATSAPTVEQTLVEGRGSHSVTVSVADLNLGTMEGQEALHYRLSSAARRVCGPADYRAAGSPRLAAENQDCYERALSAAMADTQAAALASN
jgi:UrcA family protein